MSKRDMYIKKIHDISVYESQDYLLSLMNLHNVNGLREITEIQAKTFLASLESRD